MNTARRSRNQIRSTKLETNSNGQKANVLDMFENKIGILLNEIQKNRSLVVQRGGLLNLKYSVFICVHLCPIPTS